LRLGASNVYLLDAGDALVAVDAGPDYEGAWESALAQLAEAGLQPGDVKQVLVTHGHVDHCGLASRWQQEAGARVWIAAEDAERLRHGGRDASRARDHALRFLAACGVPAALIESRPGRSRQSPAPSEAEHGGRRLANLRSVAPEHGEWPAPLRATPAEPDGLIDTARPLEIGTLRLRPMLCPGHTPGSVLVFDEASGDLYTGDHVLERIAPTPGIQFDEHGGRIRSLPLYLRSLQAVRELQPRRVLPGHGEPFVDLAGAVDRVTRTFEQHAARLLRRLQQGPDTPWGLVSRLYPHLRPEAAWLVLAEVVGLLDLLEERRQVQLEAERPRTYRPTNG
jgi:glyoxylase-like metal-dependent hydrolase (beta-lactamase superfamily II)